jgi:hypothetical protein
VQSTREDRGQGSYGWKFDGGSERERVSRVEAEGGKAVSGKGTPARNRAYTRGMTTFTAAVLSRC